MEEHEVQMFSLLFSLKKRVSPVIVNFLYGEIPSVGELRIGPS